MTHNKWLYCVCVVAASCICTLYMIQTWHTPHFTAAVIVTIVVAGVMIFGVEDEDK